MLSVNEGLLHYRYLYPWVERAWTPSAFTRWGLFCVLARADLQRWRTSVGGVCQLSLRPSRQPRLTPALSQKPNGGEWRAQFLCIRKAGRTAQRGRAAGPGQNGGVEALAVGAVDEVGGEMAGQRVAEEARAERVGHAVPARVALWGASSR